LREEVARVSPVSSAGKTFRAIVMAEPRGKGTVEVRIGIQSVPRELTVETSTPVGQVERDLIAALEGGTLFRLDVDRGGKILVPADKLAYLEFIGPEARRVGFGNI